MSDEHDEANQPIMLPKPRHYVIQTPLSWISLTFYITIFCLVICPTEQTQQCNDIPLVNKRDEGSTFGDVLYNFSLPQALQTVPSLTQTNPPISSVLNLTRTGDFYEIIINTDLDADGPYGEHTFKLVLENLNDNLPIFQGILEKNITEDTTIGTSVYILRGAAEDGDKNDIVTYSLISPGNLFYITGSSQQGEVVLNTTLDYDKGRREYQIIVIATDSSEADVNATLTFNILDSDDQNPVFNQTGGYIWDVPENTLVPAFSVSAYDPDYGVPAVSIGYRISHGAVSNGIELFHMDESTGTLTITQPLNRTREAMYLLLVEAYQLDKPNNRVTSTSVQVIVLDVNDNSPVMSSSHYTASIPENSRDNVQVLQVKATDNDQGENAEFLFHLVNQTNNAFKIDPISGVLSVNNSTLLDREKIHGFSFMVYAKEFNTSEMYKSAPSTVNITLLDRNDNAPTFLNSSYEFIINETFPLQLTFGKVSAVDPDDGRNGEILYQLEFPFTHQLLSVDANTGDLSLLENPEPQTLSVFIQAKDKGDISRMSTTHVTILVTDVNDHTPMFNIQTDMFSVSEAATFRNLAYLHVTDEDSTDNLRCSLLNSTNQFNVTYSKTFQSCVLKVIGGLDREAIEDYSLTIQVSDGLHENSTEVFVNVADENDNSPIFNSTLYNFEIDEGIYDSKFIGNIYATDKDTGNNQDIVYSLLTTSQPFDVDSISGALTVTGLLDRETNEIIHLQVLATDKGRPPLRNTSSVHIHINDINDNAPEFQDTQLEVYIKENSNPSVIYVLQATDKDQTRVNSNILYRMSSGNSSLFSVTSDGNLSTLRHLDLEFQQNYSITVEAFNEKPYSNSSLTNGSMTIHLVVTDENDEKPTFQKSLYRFQVYENNKQVIFVGRLIASDADRNPENNWITYTILSGNEKRLFYMDSGQIFTNTSLDYEELTDKVINLTIQATNDRSNAKLSSTAHVYITVLDVNEFPPNFTQANYQWNITEGQLEGNFTVKAVDIDPAENHSLTYSFTQPYEDFRINSTTGIITLLHPLWYSIGLTLDVKAEDHGNPNLSGLTRIHVNVNTIPHEPVFIRSPYNFAIEENVASDTLVGRLTVNDEDGDELLVSLNTTDFRRCQTEQLNETTIVYAICTNVSLDYETPPITRTFTVRVNDSVFSISTEVIINVTDTNDNPPVFKPSSYRVSLEENSPYPQCLQQISATDDDTGINGDITYSIVSGGDDGVFIICQNDSHPCLCTNSSLDFEVQNIYFLHIQATDGGFPTRFGYCTVEVFVEDVNDLPPVFTSHIFNASIAEQNVGDLITVSSLDNDTIIKPGYPKYTVNSTSFGNITDFEFQDATLKVLTTSIDKEREPIKSEGYFLVNISVSDGIGTNSAQVRVMVTDINDNPPDIITPGPVDIASNYPVGQTILALNVTDKDSSNEGFTYWLTGDVGPFSINSQNGTLSLYRSLTFSFQTTYNLSVFVMDHGSPPLSSQTTITINVNETNRYKPEFTEPDGYRFSVSENASPASIVGSVTAHDKDGSNNKEGQVVYSLLSSYFTINESTGEIKVKQKLDRESKCQYNLNVTAIDKGDNPKTSQTLVSIDVLDVDDNPLQMMNISKTYTVASNAKNRTLFTAGAVDGDCQSDCGNTSCLITYTWNSNLSQSEGVLSIGRHTGTVTLQSLRNTTIGKTLKLYINVSNGEESVVEEFDVYVYSPDELPIVHLEKPYIIHLEENTTQVLVDINGTIGTKPADECLQYSIEPPRLQDSENIIISQTGVLTASGLDYEFAANRTVRVILTAMYDCEANQPQPNPQNQTVIEVEVRLIDKDDCAPEFEKSDYYQDLPEDTPVGSTVTTITASDCDLSPLYNNFTYSIHPLSDHNETFTIDAFGHVTINEPLSVLRSAVYNLTLLATGVHNTSSIGKAVLTIRLLDVNNHDPVFQDTLYSFNISEDFGNASVLGRFIGRVIAKDDDSASNGQISYSIRSLSFGRLVNISQDGNITTAGLLDREVNQQINFVVVAEDHGSHSRKGTCDVVVSLIDVNDNPTEFTHSQYVGRVDDGSFQNQLVKLDWLIDTTDEDTAYNGLYYLKLYGEGSQLFDIENKAIFVNVSQAEAIDREKTSEYHLMLAAVDREGKNSSFVNLTIYVDDINDNPPKFTQSTYYYNVSENRGGMLVGQVNVTDKDIIGDHRYIITAGSQDRFTINPTTGEIRVTDGVDREVKAEYNLTVLVMNSPFNDTTEVNITVLDENDNRPVFSELRYSFRMEEESENKTIGQVLAWDMDEGANGQVSYLIPNSVDFRINSVTGLITSNIQLDRETKSFYEFEVLAVDGGNPNQTALVTVTITLMDVNDNPPVFLNINGTELYTSILEKSPVNSVIAWPRATDIDEGVNSKLVYKVEGPGAEYFNIDPDTGLMTVKERIDLNTLASKGYILDNSTGSSSTLHLTVTVCDEGISPLNSSISLEVVIEGISDLAPEFVPTAYHFTVKEGERSGSLIGVVTLKISLLNTTSNTPHPKFEIVDTQGTRNHFVIQDTSQPRQQLNDWFYNASILTTDNVIDYEMDREFSLVIRAVDGKIPERYTYTVVEISVTDVNDNSPVCTQDVLRLTYPEEQRADNLAQVEVTDKDSGANALIHFTLINDTTNGSLGINTSSGILFLTEGLDREKQSEYSFIIQASDNGVPVESCSIQGHLTLEDINDNSPVFYTDQSKLEISLPENIRPGVEVLQVYANDTDSGLNGKVFYKLDTDEDFFIHPKDGKLFCFGSLDYERKNVYNLSVTAYDLGTPQKNRTIPIQISVTNVEDTVVLKPLYTFFISGVTPLYTVVGRIQTSKSLFFNITGGNSDSTFAITNDGQISILKSPGVRLTPFNLTVMATENSTPVKVRYTTVLIYTEDTKLTVVYMENQPPYQLVIDINTTEELSGDSVFYSFVNPSYPDLFNITESTGEIFALKELDREEVSEYVLLVQVNYNPSGQRQKRSFGDNPGDIQIIIKVGDENDNPPMFPKDKLTFGLPRSESFNYLITTLSASDKDEGNNSAIIYTIVSGDSNTLGLDAQSGQLRCTRDLSDTLTSQLNVKVKATDNLGFGQSADLEVTVLVVSDSDRAILVVTQPSSVVKPFIPAIQGNLSDILSYEVSIEMIKPHAMQTDSGSKVNPEMSDIYMHAIDPTTGQIVTHDALLRRLAEKDAEIKAFFARFKIQELTPIHVSHDDYVMSVAEIALLCLAAVIFVGSLLSMAVVMYTSKRYDMESLRNQQADKARAKASEVTPNPVYTTHDNNQLDSDSAEPLELDSSLIGVFDRHTESNINNLSDSLKLYYPKSDVDPDNGQVYDNEDLYEDSTSYYAGNGHATSELVPEMKKIPIFESQELTMDLFSESTSDYDDTEIVESSLSSDQNNQYEPLPGPPDSGNVTEADIHTDKDSDSVNYAVPSKIARVNTAFHDDDVKSTGDLKKSSGDPNTSTDDLNTSTDDPNTSTGDLNTPGGDLNTPGGDLKTSTRDVVPIHSYINQPVPVSTGREFVNEVFYQSIDELVPSASSKDIPSHGITDTMEKTVDDAPITYIRPSKKKLNIDVITRL